MREILNNLSSIEILNDNKSYNIDNIKEKLIELLDGAYSTPAFAIADHEELIKAKEKGLWIEISFDNTQNYNSYDFDKLLFSLKPKYNFINFYRMTGDEYNGKCIFFNLAYKTTDLYKEIMKNIKG